MSNLTLFNNAKLPAHIASLSLPEENDEFGGGSYLPVLSIRGKEFRFRLNGQEQATGMREMECIIVRRRERTSRRYFAGKYKSGSVDQPTCQSLDGIKPNRGTEIQAETCAQCPHSAWGSKISDNGNAGFACDSYKMLVIAPMVDSALADQAVSLNLPATSIKRSKKETSNVMHFAEYVSALKQHNVPSIGVVTRMKFTSAEYPQLAFEFVRFATEAEVDAAIALRDDEEVIAAVDGTAVEPSGPITEAETPVIPAKARAVIEEEDEENDLPPQKPRPAAKKKVTAEPVDDTPDEADEKPEAPADAMDAVRRLLAARK